MAGWRGSYGHCPFFRVSPRWHILAVRLGDLPGSVAREPGGTHTEKRMLGATAGERCRENSHVESRRKLVVDYLPFIRPPVAGRRFFCLLALLSASFGAAPEALAQAIVSLEA